MGVYAIGQNVIWRGHITVLGYVIALGRTRKNGVDIILIETVKGDIYAAPEEECSHHVNGFNTYYED